MTQKYAKNAFFGRGSAPSHWGSSQCSPDSLVSWGGDTPRRPHPTQRFRRFDRTFVARHLCPPPKPTAPGALGLATGLFTVVTLSLLSFPLPSARQHPSNGDCLEVQRENYQNCAGLCDNVHSPQHTYMSVLTGPTDWVCHIGTLTLCIEAIA